MYSRLLLGARVGSMSLRLACLQLPFRSSANPIRKMVAMLPSKQMKVQAGRARVKKLFGKYMRWCQESSSILSHAAADAEIQVPAVSADFEQSEAEHAKQKADLKQRCAGREAAKSALAEATAVREREAAAFAEPADKAEIAALTEYSEKKTVRADRVEAEIVEMQNDLADIQKAFLADQEFLRDLDKNCAQRR